MSDKYICECGFLQCFGDVTIFKTFASPFIGIIEDYPPATTFCIYVLMHILEQLTV